MDEIATTETDTNENFAVEIGKAMLLSAAGTAGGFAGLLIIGAIYKKVQDRKAAKTETPEKTK